MGNATKEDLQVLKDKYFIDLEDVKAIFLSSLYSKNIKFKKEVLNAN